MTEPRRARRPFLFRWRVVAGGVLTVIGLVGFAYAIEDWRGRAAWAEVRDRALAAGEPLLLADVLPEPVASEDNFASVAAGVWNGAPDAVGWAYVSIGWEETRSQPGFGLWWAGEPVPLEAWRAYFETDDVAAWIDRHHGAALVEQAAASLRPAAVFTVDYKRGVFNGLSFLSPLRDLTRLFVLRAVSHVESGEAEAALADTLTALRLTDRLREEPFVLTQLSANANFHVALQAVRAGLARGLWSPAQLDRLRAELARPDQVRAGMRSLRADFAFTVELMHGLAEESEATVGELTGGSHGPAFLHRVPSGWVYQNLARAGRIYLDGIFPAYDAGARCIDLTRLETVDREVLALSASRPYTILARMFMPPVHRALTQCTLVQTQIDLARLACALETHRRLTGAYPATLAELPEGTVDRRDLVSGGAPLYRPEPDGGYRLYATGADGRDDGGVIAVTPTGDFNPVGGDWVWPGAPAAPGRSPDSPRGPSGELAADGVTKNRIR